GSKAQGARPGGPVGVRGGGGPARGSPHHRAPHDRLRAGLSRVPLRPGARAAARARPRPLVRRLRRAAGHAADGATRPEMTAPAEAAAVIGRLGLVRHPEGGWYRETLRDSGAPTTGRGASTAIYYPLHAHAGSPWPP